MDVKLRRASRTSIGDPALAETRADVGLETRRPHQPAASVGLARDSEDHRVGRVVKRGIVEGVDADDVPPSRAPPPRAQGQGALP
jgi:hypothetical protein